MNTFSIFLYLLLSSVSIAAQAFVLHPIPLTLSPTLVQSVPAETNLAVPGLPFAKDAWVSMIDRAQHSIDIEQMYVDGKSGEALDAVIAALKRAAAKPGLKIRFLVSKNMLNTNPETLAQIKSIPHLELRAVNYGPITGGIQHSKFWIVDQKIIYVGSQNFDWKSLTQVLETGVLLQDPVIAAQIQSIFELDWKIAFSGTAPSDLGTAPSTPANAAISLVASPPKLNPVHIRGSFDALSELIKNAKTSIRISLLDISTFASGGKEWLDLDQLLREAATVRKVKIELLVSHWNTAQPEIKTIKSLSLVPNIQVKIATVPDLATGHIPFARVNHSKIMTIDDQILWVGTSNWSQDYFFATRGIELVMKNPQLAAQGNAIFERLWDAPYAQFVDVNKDYPKPVK